MYLLTLPSKLELFLFNCKNLSWNKELFPFNCKNLSWNKDLFPFNCKIEFSIFLTTVVIETGGCNWTHSIKETTNESSLTSLILIMSTVMQ